MDQAQRDELAKLSRQFALWFSGEMDKMIPIIEARLAAGMSPASAIALAAAESGIEQATMDRILDAMTRAAEVGAGLTQGALAVDALGIRRVFLNDFWPGDEFTISERMASRGLQKRIAGEITRHLAGSQQFRGAVSTWQETARAVADVTGPRGERIQGELNKATKELVRTARLAAEGDEKALANLKAKLGTAQKAVDRLSRGGAPNQALKASYQAVIDAAQSLDASGLARSVRIATKEKAQYFAERMARTEMARAYGTGFFSEASIDPDVVAIRWAISSRHPEFDVCDLNARADFYGLGAGVYPKDKVPHYPAHPHCLCNLSRVFETENEERPYNPKRGAAYLRSLTDEQRKKLMGIEGAKDISNWESHVRSWSGHGKPQIYPNAAAVIRRAKIESLANA